MDHIYLGEVERQEFQAGLSFVEAHGAKSFLLFFRARIACLPFSICTLILCFYIASNLYGPRAGLFSAILWCFSPTSLGYGSVISPDIAAAMAGMAASFAFFSYFKTGSYLHLSCCGVALGIALLVKSTWIILIGLWPLIIFARLAINGAEFREIGRQSLRLAFVGCIAVALINMGYMFRETGKPLGEIRFVSQALTQKDVRSSTHASPGRNRFSGTFLGEIRAPLPADYLMGIDQQKRDFEYKTPSYLGGEWKYGGWWYYYVYAFLVKEPVGVLLLTLFAIVKLLASRGGFFRPRNLVFFLPAVALVLFVSSQIGFNRHYRYVLPSIPFIYVFLGGTASSIWDVRLGRYFVISSLSMVICTGLLASPRHLSYFNEIAGGARGGPKHLLNSNLDWGQDLLPLKHWLARQSASGPVFLAYSLPNKVVEPRQLGIQYREIPKMRAIKSGRVFFDFSRLKPGLYIIFVDRLFGIDGEYEMFRELEPDLVIGTTAYVYSINKEQLSLWALHYSGEDKE
jgi:hypothetical protein